MAASIKGSYVSDVGPAKEEEALCQMLGLLGTYPMSSGR
jgi:hypothetical protein